MNRLVKAEEDSSDRTNKNRSEETEGRAVSGGHRPRRIQPDQ